MNNTIINKPEQGAEPPDGHLTLTTKANLTMMCILYIF